MHYDLPEPHVTRRTESTRLLSIWMSLLNSWKWRTVVQHWKPRHSLVTGSGGPCPGHLDGLHLLGTRGNMLFCWGGLDAVHTNTYLVTRPRGVGWTSRNGHCPELNGEWWPDDVCVLWFKQRPPTAKQSLNMQYPMRITDWTVVMSTLSWHSFSAALMRFVLLDSDRLDWRAGVKHTTKMFC